MQIKTELPSYDESVYSNTFQNQKLKSIPSHFEKKLLFEFIENIQPSPGEKSEKTTNAPAEPLNNRLERLSSYIQQMIDAAQSSLINATMEAMDNDNSLATIGDILENQQRQINKKASIERLRLSQSSLARTIDQLNASIIHSVIDAATSPISDPSQQMGNDDKDEDSNTSVARHHHYHHHHHHHHHHSNRRQNQQRKDSLSTKPQNQHLRSSPSSPSARSSSVSLWTNVLTQTTLVFCICHCILSWTKLTSSMISAAWLVGLLCIKKRRGYTSKSSSSLLPPSSSSSLYTNLKSSLVPRIYLILLALFGQH